MVRHYDIIQISKPGRDVWVFESVGIMVDTFFQFGFRVVRGSDLFSEENVLVIMDQRGFEDTAEELLSWIIK